VRKVHPVSVWTSGRSPVEQTPSKAPDGRPAPPNPATEVGALAALLAEVVELAGSNAVFLSRLQVIAEVATEHDSVGRVLATNEIRVMSPPRPQPDNSSHTLRSLLMSASKSPDTADHARRLAMFTSDAAVSEHIGVPVRGGPRPPVMPREPDTAVMTTAAAARYLGLAGRDSARIWLGQRGIRPVGREPGHSGQNLYLAEAVLPLKGRGADDRPMTRGAMRPGCPSHRVPGWSRSW
jgi:hypothetical protein